MLKRSLLLALISVPLALQAQDSTYVLDLLQSPLSPGADLVGTAPADIQRPTDPSAFMVSVLDATDNLSALPSNYAVDIAPAWLFSARNIDYSSYSSNKLTDNLWQNFVLSAAIKNVHGDSLKYTDIGLGFKVSLFRGYLDKQLDKAITAANELLKTLLIDETEARQAWLASDEYKILLEKKKNKEIRLEAFLQAVKAQNDKISDSANKLIMAKKEVLDSLEALSAHTVFKRYGFKMDFSGGLSIRYPDQVFNDARINKGGAWLTIGYEWEAGLSALGILRYLYHPDQVYADEQHVLKQGDLQSFDGGLRLLYNKGESPFTGGAEIIYRSVLNYKDIPATWRFTVNLDYKLKKNTLLSLSLGKDYDGTYNKDSSLLAALNLLLGFGNGRQLTSGNNN